MAEDKLLDPARIEQLERRLQALEDAEAIRNLKARYAALCDQQYDADGIAALFTEDAVWDSPGLGRFEGREAISSFFRGASKIFSCHPLQPEWPDRSGRRYGAGELVSVHAVHGRHRKPGDVARQHRSRNLRAGGRNLDVPLETVGAADERALRDRLGRNAVSLSRLVN
jgi:SnoaL-like protein